MKDFLKRIKFDYILSSLFTIALGVVFVIWRGKVLDIMGSAFALILIAIGVLYVGSFFLKVISNGFSVVMGVIVLAIGLWILIQPSVVIKLIPILLGVVLVFHGIRGMIEAVNAKNFGGKTWKAGMVLATISILIGIICVVDAFGIMENAIAIVGIFLIYNGVSDILITNSSTRAERKYHKAETIDTQFVGEKETDSIEG